MSAWYICMDASIVINDLTRFSAPIADATFLHSLLIMPSKMFININSQGFHRFNPSSQYLLFSAQYLPVEYFVIIHVFY